MSFFRVLGIMIIVVGIALFIFGVAATQKTGEKVFGAITGNYTDATMWYIIGGLALVIGGIVISRVKNKR